MSYTAANETTAWYPMPRWSWYYVSNWPYCYVFVTYFWG